MRELALHVLDLVQNSIEANADMVKINIEEDNLLDVFRISIIDNGCGIDEKYINNVKNPFHTSRKTRRVGLGLALIDMSTKQCDGYLKIHSQINKGTCVEAVYKHSHIDRPPLGNIIDTVKVLIVGNPKVNIVYAHKVNNKYFSLSSREITELLGDIPLGSPEVILWLTNYLQDNENMLYYPANGGNFNENS